MLKELFPRGRFSLPATETQVAAVEADLGVRLPDQLRQLYFICDGFREDRGNAKYLLSLTEDDFIGSLLQTTRFFWSGWLEHELLVDLRSFVVFGSSSGDEVWGINWRRSGEVIAYHHHMEGQYEVCGSDIIEVYQADYAKYDKLED